MVKVLTQMRGVVLGVGQEKRHKIVQINVYMCVWCLLQWEMVCCIITPTIGMTTNLPSTSSSVTMASFYVASLSETPSTLY